MLILSFNSMLPALVHPLRRLCKTEATRRIKSERQIIPIIT